MERRSKNELPTIAIIYARVSSVAQLKKGHGLESQITRCREYARLKGYEVGREFSDDAVSGGVLDRPGILAMLQYVKENAHLANFIIIIDDISRLARDIKTHLELRDAISLVGATLESPSIEFGEDSDSILVENLLASVSQHQRQKNAEQTKNRMRARLMNGYYPFIPCMGFKQIHQQGEGKVLVRDEPLASLIQEGMEGFANGRFTTQAELKRFWENCPAFPKNKKGKIRNQLVNDILTKLIYAGYVEKTDWGVSLRKGRHEGMVSFETFELIQKRLKGEAKMPARADINEDFALRSAVSCGCCGRKLTGYWAKGRNKPYAYYECFNKQCDMHRKSIRRDLIEGEFVELLEAMQPRRELLEVSKAIFKDMWDQRIAQASEMAKAYKSDISKLEKKIEGLLDRIVDASSDSIVSAYEKRISSMQREVLVLEEKSVTTHQPRGTFEQVFEPAFRFLASPSKLWRSGRFEWQKLVLKLTFAEELAYVRNEGFRTPKTTLPFNMLGEKTMLECRMAEKKGASVFF